MKKILEKSSDNTELHQSESRFRRLTENAQDLIYRYEFTPKRGFTYVSPSATAITGYTPEEHYADPDLGLKIVYPDDRPLLEQYFLDKGKFNQPLALRWIRKDGQIIITEQINIPIYDEKGNLILLEGIARDITEHKRVEQDLLETSQFNQQILACAGEGILACDNNDLFVLWNQRMEEISGLPATEVIGKHPLELFPFLQEQGVWTLFQRAKSGETVSTPDYQFFVPSSGQSGWAITKYAPHRNIQGEIVGVIGIVHEITARKQVEVALQETSSRLAALADNLPSGILFETLERMIVYANQAFYSLFSIPESVNLVGFDCSMASVQSSHLFANSQGFLQGIETCIKEQRLVQNQELQLADGRVFERDYIPIWSNETSLGHLWHYRDITDRKHEEERVRHLSTHDALTGLYNRGFFEEELRRLGRSRQFPISIIMADVDKLKDTNDHEGHAAGDALLKRVAQVLTNSFRAEDVVARLGGDEFAVLLPLTDADMAEAVLTRIRRILHESNITHGGTPVSLSLGASTAEKGVSLDDTLRQADDRMYLDKRCR